MEKITIEITSEQITIKHNLNGQTNVYKHKVGSKVDQDAFYNLPPYLDGKIDFNYLFPVEISKRLKNKQ